MGLAEHELRDVKPHSADPIFYCNPFPVTTSLALRRFPVDDNNRDILAFQE